MSAVTATASPAPPGPAAAGLVLRLTRGEGTFGGTWQGEGSRLGTWTMGVRVYGCNLHCGLLQGSWSARTAAIPPTPGTSRTIHNRSGPTRPPSTRSWRSWNGACSHGCGAAARGWCSSPAANPSSRGRRWASSCGLPGAGMAHPDRDQWHPAAEAAGRARLLARRLQRLTQAGDWHQPGRRSGVRADPPQGHRRTPGYGPGGLEVRRCRVEDLDEIDWWIERFGLPIDNVWVMPEGTSTAGLTAPIPSSWLMRCWQPEPHHSPAHPRLGG